MKGEIISTRTVMKKIAKDRKVIPELFVEIDKRIQERINFEKNKEAKHDVIHDRYLGTFPRLPCLLSALFLRIFHASSPSTSGKTHVKPSYIQIRQTLCTIEKSFH